MSNGTKRSALICQLEPGLETELKRTLEHPSIAIKANSCATPEACIQEIRELRPDVVFVSAIAEAGVVMERVIPGVPVIVVSRAPDTNEWLDAIEAGAADYCAPPFEARQILWILQSAVRHPSFNATAA